MCMCYFLPAWIGQGDDWQLNTQPDFVTYMHAYNLGTAVCIAHCLGDQTQQRSLCLLLLIVLALSLAILNATQLFDSAWELWQMLQCSVV